MCSSRSPSRKCAEVTAGAPPRYQPGRTAPALHSAHHRGHFEVISAEGGGHRGTRRTNEAKDAELARRVRAVQRIVADIGIEVEVILKCYPFSASLRFRPEIRVPRCWIRFSNRRACSLESSVTSLGLALIARIKCLIAPLTSDPVSDSNSFAISKLESASPSCTARRNQNRARFEFRSSRKIVPMLPAAALERCL
jgi:hypothetical protein